MTHSATVLCAGSYRLAQIKMGSRYWSVDFGLPVSIKVLITAKGIRNATDIALRAAEHIDGLKGKMRQEVVDFIRVGASTETIAWINGENKMAAMSRK